MKHPMSSGTTLAIAAASLALIGAAAPAVAQTVKVHCLGANSCKGKTDCQPPPRPTDQRLLLGAEYWKVPPRLRLLVC